ncbi:hypothetical protein OH77DRAFT_360732 [Trametes cingulata]|nr:hypothetical protein OH77DRAFT_360732 [Trametes cingulata]
MCCTSSLWMFNTIRYRCSRLAWLGLSSLWAMILRRFCLRAQPSGSPRAVELSIQTINPSKSAPGDRPLLTYVTSPCTAAKCR